MSQFAIICPSCKQLINRNSKRCPNCGWVNSRWSNIALSRQNAGKLLIYTNCAIYVLALILSAIFTTKQFYNLFSLFSPSGVILQILGWAEQALIFDGQFWRLVSSLFLHGSILHLVFNMLWLHMLFPQLEGLIGKDNTISIYFISGLAGSILATTLNPVPVVGASGAIFGLIGAFIACAKSSSNILLNIAANRHILFVVIMLIIGFLLPNVSNLSHIGGAAAGFGLGYLISRQSLFNKYSSIIASISIGLIGITLGKMLWEIVITLFL